jgi:transposase InsO family protein
MKETPLEPSNHAEAVALFRAEVIGAIARMELSRGELRARIVELSRQKFRPPGSPRLKSFGVSTLERWYYHYRKHGLRGLHPSARSDRGRARQLDPKLQDLAADIRREFPSASAVLIVRTLKKMGLVSDLTPTTLRRFYAQRGLTRGAREPAPGNVRLRWQAERPHALWHGDVCHGPTLNLGGRRVPLRIHGMLDDCSRGVLALEPLETEREVDMLEVFIRALLIHGKPDALYLDNGATYRGHALRLACERLGITLIHAQPHDPQARGKMERFWRTLREQCLDFIGAASSLHDVRARLVAFADEYHRTPHSGLMGECPGTVVITEAAKPVDEKEIRDALTTTVRRRVRTDSTLSISGKTYQVREAFLGGRVVTARVYAVDQVPEPFVMLDGRRYRLEPVEPKLNATLRRERTSGEAKPSTGFDPNQARLDELLTQIREEEEDNS